MSGLPVFVDPSATVVYHTTPTAGSGSGQGHAQQQLPPTVTMSVVQSNSQRTNDPLSNVPLPPGMEIVLGGKKYKIQYQSYEMTREKATEYIAKCTGTPYSRMSAPPDPETFSRTWGAVGGSSDGAGTSGGNTTAPGAIDARRVNQASVPITIAGDRGTIGRASISRGISDDKYQSQKTPDEVYTTMAPLPSGLTPGLPRGGALPQQQQPPTLPEQQVGTAESGNYQVPTYAPPPKDSDQRQENLGYFWEDGVWKVWQSDSRKTPTSTVGEPEASNTMAPPLPAQQTQYPQHAQASYPSQQLQAERPQYQYQYNYTEQRQQQQQQQQQLQHQQSLVATSASHDPSSYTAPYAPPPHHSQQPPSVRGPPQPAAGLLQTHGIADSSNATGARGGDSMIQRYMI